MNTKLEAACAMLKEGSKKVYLITGMDSPDKEWFVKDLLMSIFKFDVITTQSGKVVATRPTVATTFANEKEYPMAYAVAFKGVDRLSGYDVDRFVLAVRRHIDSGRVAIISTQSLEKLTERLGEDFTDYISHLAVNIDLSIPRREIPTI